MNRFEADQRPMRVLLLSGDLGEGHNQAARALAEACGLPRLRIQTEVVNFMRQVYPGLHPIIKYFFLRGVEKAPSLYGYLYRKTHGLDRMSISFRSFLSIGLGKLTELIASTRPDVIVCTFPLAAAAVSLLKEKGLLRVPLVTVITDHTDHSLWLHPHTDLYLVGSEAVAGALTRRGIVSSRLCVTGIPVRQRFFETPDRGLLYRSLGLSPERPTVLVMGGGGGMFGDDIRMLIRSSAVREKLQMVIVCGSNAEVRCLLEEEVRRCGAVHVIVKGFVEEIHEWMAVADVLVTKPGGLTTAEAVAMGLPMLLYKPIPGQEEDNADVLERAGVAVRAAANRALGDQLLELAFNGERLQRMQEQAGRFRCEQSSALAWDAILKLQPRMPARAGRSFGLKVREAL
ncbi:Processive diacylglycerol beta-glucosyltransferase [Paenibacillus solanacearum]|uniref:Processive diacylglycerol beta-glucosyltransferase n=1 Tax=Paenibacillus solanacearum TaxID=2048548 RepID=A0A916NQG5_9BACL|nr:glycosyltransferase [Paenibacillus solanacearum]CAG7635593.1 Processive diacylglycerol beta-glucosyltransferase [Paenibacillus solanacearum]